MISSRSTTETSNATTQVADTIQRLFATNPWSADIYRRSLLYRSKRKLVLPTLIYRTDRRIQMAVWLLFSYTLFVSCTLVLCFSSSLDLSFHSRLSSFFLVIVSQALIVFIARAAALNPKSHPVLFSGFARPQQVGFPPSTSRSPTREGGAQEEKQARKERAKAHKHKHTYTQPALSLNTPSADLHQRQLAHAGTMREIVRYMKHHIVHFSDAISGTSSDRTMW